MLFSREKMAFFTRVNTTVPCLPSTECHSEPASSLPESADVEISNIESRDNESNKSNKDNKNSEGLDRYNYVLDRVLGVEV